MNLRTPALLVTLSVMLGACGSGAAPSDGAVDLPSALPTDATDSAVAPDAAMGCAMLARCVARCADGPCAAACRAQASPEAVRLLQAQSACVFGDPRATPPVAGQCPTSGGGACDAARPGFTAAACEACIAAAQSVGGACDAQVVACQRYL